MSEAVREFFERDVSFKNPKDVVDEIVREWRKLQNVPPEQREERIKSIARGIKNEICECNHPIVKKMIDFGTAKGKLECARALERIIQDLLSRGIKSTEDVKKIEEAVEEFKRGLMEYVENRFLKGRRGS